MTGRGPMTEAELLERVRRLAADYHVALFHVHDARRSTGRGFPDLVLAGPSGHMFVELKNNRTSLTPDQRRWGSVLTAAGAKWTVWRPRDLDDCTIESMIARISVHKQESITDG